MKKGELSQEELYELSKKIYYMAVEFEKSGLQVSQGRTEIFAEMGRIIKMRIEEKS